MTSPLLRLICLALFILPSCASYYAQQTNLTPRIEQWQQQHQYDKAINVINFLSPEHPQFEALQNTLPLLEQRRTQYIRDSLAQADQAASNQDWVFAIAITNQALTNLPNAPELLSKREHYLQQQAIRNQRDRAAILVARANYFIAARPFQESLIYNAGRSFEARQQYEQFQSEAKNTSRELFALADIYWQQKLTSQAKSTLQLSLRTAPNPLSEELLITVLAYETEQRRVARRQQTQAATDQLPELLASFNNFIQNDELSAAQWILNELTELKAPESAQLSLKLQSLKHDRAEHLISRGNKLYNAGLLDEAIESWQEALTLTPNNKQLEQNIFRAQTFIGNIERWSDN